MSFTKEKIKDFYLLTTEVENIFINEYMPTAPGDYVKVYLYGLLYSQTQDNMTYKEMAKQLNLSERQIDDAWNYWQRMGVIEKHSKGQGLFLDYDIEYKQLRGMMYGLSHESSINQDYEKKEEPVYDEDLKDILLNVENMLGKVLSPKDTKEVFSWIKDVNATKEVIFGAISYCLEKGKTGVSYMSKVVQQWTEDGLRTSEDVREYLGGLEQKFARYKSILQTLGINRGVTKAEREIIDRWFDEMGFNTDRVMEACCKGSFIPSPNVRYVNGILEKWYEEAKVDGRNVNSKVTVTQAVLNRYYEYLRKKEHELKLLQEFVGTAEEDKAKLYCLTNQVNTLKKENQDFFMKLLEGTKVISYCCTWFKRKKKTINIESPFPKKIGIYYCKILITFLMVLLTG